MRTMLLFLILALAACGGNDPVADKGTTLPDNMVGDAPGAGLAAPANAAAAETSAEAALPPPTDGMAWQVDRAAHAARFGPTGSAAMAAMPLTIDCAVPRTMRLVRGEAPSSGKATLSFTGNGHVASLVVNAINSTYLGIASGDTLRAIARTFNGPAPVEATVGEAGDLRLPSTPAIRQFLGSCARG